MSIRLRINLSQPLIFGTYAPNEFNDVNWIAFQFLDLPRLLCSFCKRLGHLAEDCIELFIVTHPGMHIPQPLQLAQLEYMSDPDDNYTEEERYNVDQDEPDPDWSDWSLEVFPPTLRPSPISSDQYQSGLSFSEGEQSYEGYNQSGFNSYISLDSERTQSDEFNSWHSANSLSSNGYEAENQTSQGSLQVEDQASPLSHLSPRIPANFITSDIDPDFEMVSDSESSACNNLSGPGHKRLNPEQQNYLHISGIGSSSATHNSRRISGEDLDQWRSQYKPSKRIKCASSSLPCTSKEGNFKPDSSNSNNYISSSNSSNNYQ
ncbi:hypothetical protein MKW98_002098 [Papaver atlanticum]|uniref:Uncharacterized protein n=1 Tax=Papaver atlanticum TaxID=357466 RepID=A0AAD4RU62_9MAGN|nr:hypothetical protein MKW98_002098 [Papaver atlanticum]